MPDQTSQDKKTQDEEDNPFDSLMDKIDGFMSEKNLDVKKALSDIKSDVESIRGDVEGEDEDDEDDGDDEERPKGGLAILIGKVKKGDK